ncbi:hypothetical protein AVEN_237663-1 [Araneus ventricosus]|uniref:Uncharacterized protein n=1 Tax=Araneus ventricosus TaxID=182803 RepID=A0A4Y2KDT6_ARAVE|nr:hypothetical protein AVEN_237663-1 [Araneus ventricosus]
MRHELDSPRMGGHLPHPHTDCYNLPLRRSETGKDNWTSYRAYLRSDLRTSPQKKPPSSNRSSPFLRENFYTSPDLLSWCERVKEREKCFIDYLCLPKWPRGSASQIPNLSASPSH